LFPRRPGGTLARYRQIEKPTTVERAFEIAASGRVATIIELRYVLLKEGFAPEQLYGPLLKKQLKDLIDRSREARVAPIEVQ
jgi:hypothetical protein